MTVAIEPVAKAAGKSIPKLVKNPVFLVGAAGAVILGVLAMRGKQTVSQADAVGSYSMDPQTVTGAGQTGNNYSDVLNQINESQSDLLSSVSDMLDDYQNKNNEAIEALTETVNNPIYLTDPSDKYYIPEKSPAAQTKAQAPTPVVSSGRSSGSMTSGTGSSTSGAGVTEKDDGGTITNYSTEKDFSNPVLSEPGNHLISSSGWVIY